jgi:hypothetical protein
MRPRRKIFNCQRMCYRTAYVSVEELPVPSAAAVESAQLEPMVRNSSVGSASALVGGGIMVGAVAYENGFARGWEQRAENNFGAAKRTRTSTPVKELAPQASASTSSAMAALFAVRQAAQSEGGRLTNRFREDKRGRTCLRITGATRINILTPTAAARNKARHRGRAVQRRGPAVPRRVRSAQGRARNTH